MSLNSQVKEMLNQLNLSGWKDVSELTPESAREQANAFAKLKKFPFSLSSVISTDFNIPRENNENMLLRLYRPQNTAHNAAIVFYHGGGYVLGDVELYHTTCQWIAFELNLPVISVDYRLAPQYSFPIQIEDGYTALKWIESHADELNVNSKALIVAGDSAGGHLATMVSILARDRAGPSIAGQWLMYPWVDNNFSRHSFKTYETGFGLSRAGAEWFCMHYLGKQQKVEYPAFPFQVDDLSHLPPTYIVAAECDVLFDEVNDYAEKLKKFGNKVHYDCAEGMIHGFINHYPISASFHAAKNMFAEAKQFFAFL